MHREHIAQLVAAVVAGSHQAAGRLITLLEDDGAGATEALRALFPHTGRAHVVGITGPPGSGKSTLASAAIRGLRSMGQRVGVVAVDPTSPFTGGALLGDRIRMQDHSTDPEVFVRSMATRGGLGGLAPTTGEAVAVLDAWGATTIFIETVGTGQAEVDIVSAADTVVVVSSPGLGDSVQTLKAGVMEIGDIFVVNKADRPDADRAVVDLKMTLQMSPERAWQPPVLTTVATTGEGVARLLAAVADHRRHLEDSGDLAARRRNRWRREIVAAVEARLRAQVMEGVGAEGLDALVGKVAAGDLDPRAAAERLIGIAGHRVPGTQRGRPPDTQEDHRPGAPALALRRAAARIDHLGVAVRSIEAAGRFYREVLDLNVGPAELLPDDGINAAFVALGDVRIELLEPASPDGPVARFLERRGEGIHHIAVAVPDVAAALETARLAGYTPVDRAPRRGAHGSLVAFLHPRDTHGVLIELVEWVPG
jgi:LAO/AO transport system kinase